MSEYINNIVLHYKDGYSRYVDFFIAKHGSRYNNQRPCAMDLPKEWWDTDEMYLLATRLHPLSDPIKCLRFVL